MGCSLFALFYNNSVQLWRNRFAEASTLHWKGDDIFMSDYQPMTCLPVLALRGLVVFPGCVTHFDVGRTKSVRSVEEAMRANQTIFLVAQRDLETDDPKKADLYEIGTVATVKQILRLPGDNMRILVEGQYRAKLLDMIHSEPYLFGRVLELDELGYRHDPLRLQALIRQGHELFGQFVDLAVKAGQESMLQILSSDEPGKLADVIGQNATFPYDQKQRILEQLHPVKRLELAIELLAQELDILQLESEISEKVQENVNKNQRDYYLREQIHAIREELGEDDSDDENYAERIRALGLPEATEEKLLREVKRLGRQQGGSPEANVIRNYLDTVLELPWNEETKERLDVKAARKILDADHFGLEKVKERILETLAVRQLAPELPGQILCLVGPPGVGKTSVAISIAKALNRKLARLSLGGVRDEAEIRGHRKTYIGAMPGRIIQTIKRCGSSNPVVILDEIDKITVSNHGDPSSALLEVLDPEQNTTFHDNYLDTEYDLSKVLFIATANNIANINPALRDRMEMINIPGYILEDKVQIARKHLIPKQLEAHGVSAKQLRIAPKTIEKIVAEYTRESGVRTLDKRIAKIVRTRAKNIGFDEEFRPEVTAEDVEKILGVPRYQNESYEIAGMVGVVTGLAWTEVGGDILYIESILTPGKGGLTMTGNLGDVMKESATIALEWVKAHGEELGIDREKFEKFDVNIHVPEGAIPKDGPSAGITMVTSLVSTFTGRPVRDRVAMTGETTLRGRVMPVGGIKEKILAAKRAGINEIILSEDNRKDISEIKPEYLEGLTFDYVRTNDDVLRLALSDR